MSASHKTGMDPALITMPELYAKVCCETNMQKSCMCDMGVSSATSMDIYACEFIVYHRKWNHS